MIRGFCDGCGGLFDWPDTIRPDARYHSNACRQKTYRRRKKTRDQINSLGPTAAVGQMLRDAYAAIGWPVPEDVTEMVSAPKVPFVCGESCNHEPFCPTVTGDAGAELEGSRNGG